MGSRYAEDEERIGRWIAWFGDRPGDPWDLADEEYLTDEECGRFEEAWRTGEEPPPGPFVHDWWKGNAMDVRIKEQVVTLGEVVGEGGEARVYRLGPDTLAKVYRLPTDPELDPAQLDAARLRVVVAQRKLRLFPVDLPETVVSPRDLVKETASGLVVGYTMPFVKGARPLADFKSAAIRSSSVTDRHVVSVFRGLMGTVRAVHERGTVIGDFNDTNVLVRGADAFVIDADSFQYGPYRSKVFMPAFVDPNRCDPNLPRLELAKVHDVESDWYAWWVMLFQSLLFIHPYGGVHKPSDRAKVVPAAVRGLPQHRVSVYDPDVRYPSQARPLDDVPEVLANYFKMVFVAGLRPEPTDAVFDALAFKSDGSFDRSRVVAPAALISVAKVTAAVVRDDGSEVVAASFTDGQLTVLGLAPDGWLLRDGSRVGVRPLARGPGRGSSATPPNGVPSWAWGPLGDVTAFVAGQQHALADGDGAVVFSPGWAGPVKAKVKPGALSRMVAGSASGTVFYDGRFKVLLGRAEPVVKVLDVDPEVDPLGMWAEGDLLFVLCSLRGKLGYVVHHVAWDQTICQQAHPFATPWEVEAARGYPSADGTWICVKRIGRAPSLFALDARGHLLNQVDPSPCASLDGGCPSGKMLFFPIVSGVVRLTPDGEVTEFHSAEDLGGCRLVAGDNIYAVSGDARRVLRLTVS